MNKELEKKYKDFVKLLHSDYKIKHQGEEEEITIKEFLNFSDYIKEKYIETIPKTIKIFMKIKIKKREITLKEYNMQKKKVISNNKEGITIKKIIKEIEKKQRPIFLHHLKNQILTRIDIRKVGFPELAEGVKLELED